MKQVWRQIESVAIYEEENSFRQVFYLQAISLALSTQASVLRQQSDGASNYQYQYEVEHEPTGTYFGASESKHNYDTQGQFHVALPDGTTQTVDYKGDFKESYLIQRIVPSNKNLTV